MRWRTVSKKTAFRALSCTRWVKLLATPPKNRLLGVNGNYKTGNFSVGFAYNTKRNELGQDSLTSAVLGASMNVGSGTISAMGIKITDDNPSSLSAIAPALTPQIGAAAANLVQAKFLDAFKQDGTLLHIGYRHVTGPHTMSVAYTQYDDQRPCQRGCGVLRRGLHLRAVQAHRPERCSGSL
jgi:hypothetical protein